MKNGQNLIVEQREIQDPVIAPLETLIKNHIVGIEELKAELKEKKNEFKKTLDSDKNYFENEADLEVLVKNGKEIKNRILQQPGMMELNQKIKDSKSDLKDRNKTLSDLLNDYKEKTRTNQLTLFDGQVVDIIQIGKYKRK